MPKKSAKRQPDRRLTVDAGFQPEPGPVRLVRHKPVVEDDEDDALGLFHRPRQEDPVVRVVTRPGDAIDMLTQLETGVKDPLLKLRFYAELIRSRRLARLVFLDMRMSQSLGQDKLSRLFSRWERVNIAQSQSREGTTGTLGEQGGPLQ